MECPVTPIALPPGFDIRERALSSRRKSLSNLGALSFPTHSYLLVAGPRGNPHSRGTPLPEDRGLLAGILSGPQERGAVVSTLVLIHRAPWPDPLHHSQLLTQPQPILPLAAPRLITWPPPPPPCLGRHCLPSSLVPAHQPFSCSHHHFWLFTWPCPLVEVTTSSCSPGPSRC